jgi:hypothetical protein
LKGADKATVQDALADAEEHLRTALDNIEAESAEQEESNTLLKIIQDYGEPNEIAAAYREWENSLPPALEKTPAARRAASSINGTKSYPGFFGVYSDPRAWGGLVYMLISVITGCLYFSWAVAGLSTSLGVMILIIGIPVTILFLLSFRGLAFLEGRLVEALLGVRMPRRASFTDSSLPWKDRLIQLLTGKSTWLSWLYLILMLPLGVIYFTVMITLIALSLSFVLTPLASLVMISRDIPIYVINSGDIVWSISDSSAILLSLGLAVLGAMLGTASMHLARVIGRLHGNFAKALLVSD